MLTLIGDILNWLALVIVFPLMMLPLAVFIGGSRTSSFLSVWWPLVIGLAFIAIAFAFAAPDLAPDPLLLIYFQWLMAVTAFAFILEFGSKYLKDFWSRHFPELVASPDSLTNWLSRWFEKIVRSTGRGVMWLVLMMALVQFVVVILRYVFGVNFIFLQESVTYFHGFVFLLAAGYALLTDDHVRVDIFYREAPERRKALVNFLGTYFLLFPFCLVTLWAAGPYVASSWSVQEGSTEQSGVQGVYILKSLIPVFAILLAMAGFSLAAKSGAVLRRKKA